VGIVGEAGSDGGDEKGGLAEEPGDGDEFADVFGDYGEREAVIVAVGGFGWDGVGLAGEA
jgi:hypothetical protein